MNCFYLHDDQGTPTIFYGDPETHDDYARPLYARYDLVQPDDEPSARLWESFVVAVTRLPLSPEARTYLTELLADGPPAPSGDVVLELIELAKFEGAPPP